MKLSFPHLLLIILIAAAQTACRPDQKSIEEKRETDQRNSKAGPPNPGNPTPSGTPGSTDSTGGPISPNPDGGRK
jgi:hypothetical protein